MIEPADAPLGETGRIRLHVGARPSAEHLAITSPDATLTGAEADECRSR